VTQKIFALLAGSSGRILTESAAEPHKRQVIMYSCVTKEQEKKSISISGSFIMTAVCLWDIHSYISLLGYCQILKDLSGLWQLF